jgi:hypothetical protein
MEEDIEEELVARCCRQLWRSLQRTPGPAARETEVGEGKARARSSGAEHAGRKDCELEEQLDLGLGVGAY